MFPTMSRESGHRPFILIVHYQTACTHVYYVLGSVYIPRLQLHVRKLCVGQAIRRGCKIKEKNKYKSKKKYKKAKTMRFTKEL